MLTLSKFSLTQFVPCLALRFFVPFIGRKHKVYIKYGRDKSKIARSAFR